MMLNDPCRIDPDRLTDHGGGAQFFHEEYTSVPVALPPDFEQICAHVRAHAEANVRGDKTSYEALTVTARNLSNAKYVTVSTDAAQDDQQTITAEFGGHTATITFNASVLVTHPELAESITKHLVDLVRQS